MKILIVDDEPTARRGLRRQLDELPDVVCVGECGGRDAAVVAIVERRPDVVLLDIQLGRTTAFDIIEEIGVDAMPLVVFVTAYDRHALKAFEVHALDYVLKPVDPARLREALERAASFLSLQRGATLADRLEALLAQHTPPAPTSEAAVIPSSDRLVVRDGDRLSFVEIDHVEWFESAGNYVQVHSGGKTYTMRGTMDRIAQRIGGRDTFVRVRRSAIVNLRAVATLERYSRSAYVVHLKNGTKIISSRYYQPGLRRLLKTQ
ncbi:MAG TPA: LytTR family DNA-binding domain-containing protein [Gemmatimonadaceae bacterium]|nr:LytTR family DNA-binding domain-containing protein [Gemmatimonadaceae bacterium]